MQIESYTKEDIVRLLHDANNIAVIPSKIGGAEPFAAAVGLYEMIKQQGKQAKLLYIGKIPNEVSHLVPQDEIVTNLSKRDLIIRVDYSGTHAGNVHWKNNNDILEFRLGPVPKDFDTSRVKVKMANFGFDLIFVIGTQHVQDLGQIYSNLEEEFRSAKIVNLDNTKRNSRYGVVNVIDDTCDTLSLLIYKYAPDWNLIPGSKSAKALLTGMSLSEAKMVA